MRKPRCYYAWLLTLVVIVLVPLRNAHAAFWDGVGKMSGPGPFMGFNLVYPFTIGGAPDRLGVGMLEHPGTRLILNNYYLPFRLEIDPLKLAKDEKLLEAMGEWLETDAFEMWTVTGKRHEELLRDLENELTSFLQDQNQVVQKTEGAGVITSATETLRQFNQWVLTQPDVLAYFKSRYRRPGWSKAWGLFTSTAALRLPEVDDDGNLYVDDEGNTNNVASNNYLTVAIGYRWSLENDLPYADEQDENTRVHWITVYPAYERRWKVGRDGTKSVFVNGGPAFHQFSGASFDTFYKTSIRGRVGLRYHSLSFGGELEYFVDEVQHSEFGSTDPGEHRWGYGFFTNVELPDWNR